MIQQLRRIFFTTVFILCLQGFSTPAHADGSFAIPSEGIALPNGVKVLPDGSIIHNDLTITSNNVFIRGKSVGIPGETFAKTTGSQVYADRIVFSNGKQYYWQRQTVILPDGRNILSDGTIVASGATPIQATRGYLTSEGVRLPGGEVIAPNLVKVLASATLYANELPHEYSAETTAAMSKVLPASEMAPYFKSISAESAGNAFDAMNLSPEQLANYSQSLDMSSSELGAIFSNMQSYSPEQMRDVMGALKNSGMSNYELEQLIGSMGGVFGNMDDLSGFLSGLGLGGDSINRLQNLFGNSGSGLSIASDDGFGGHNMFSSQQAASGPYQNQALIGEEITGSPSPVPINHLTTPRASLIAQYSPKLYVKPMDTEDEPHDYAGDFARSKAPNPRIDDNMLNFRNSNTACIENPSDPACFVGAGNRFRSCLHQLKPSEDYEDMSLQEKAAYNRMRLDNCANQYILMSAAYPEHIDYPQQYAPPGFTAENSCQPLDIRQGILSEYNDNRITDPFGFSRSGKNYLREYIEGAWKKLLQDESHRIRPGIPFISPGAAKEPRYSSSRYEIDNPLTVADALDGGFNLTRVEQLYLNKYEQIIDPSHPFSPRWDYGTTERQKYSPMANEKWGADEENSVYCAGTKALTDEWNCNAGYGCVKDGEGDDLDDEAVHIMDFRAIQFDNDMQIRMRFNERCENDEISEDLKDMTIGCWIEIYNVRIYLPCKFPTCYGNGDDGMPCSVNYKGKDSWFLELALREFASSMDSVAELAAAYYRMNQLMSTADMQADMADSEGMFTQNVASMGTDQFNMESLLSDQGFQSVMGSNSANDMFSFDQREMLSGLNEYQSLIGDVNIGNFQTNIGGVNTNITGLNDFQSRFGTAIPTEMLDFNNPQIMGALEQELGTARYTQLASQGWENVGSFESLIGPNGDLGSFIENPVISGAIGQQNLDTLHASMNASEFFSLDDPSSVADLRSWLGPRYDELRASGELNDMIEGGASMVELAGGADQLNSLWSSDSLPESMSGYSPSSMVQSTDMQDIVFSNPFNETFSPSQQNELFSSDGFGEIASYSQNIGQLVGGMEGVSSLRNNMNFMGQLGNADPSQFMQAGMGNMSVLGTDVFQNMLDKSMVDVWGVQGFQNNIPDLHNIMDPNMLSNMTNQVNASEYVNVNQFRSFINNPDISSAMGSDRVNMFNGMSNNQLNSYLSNNSLNTAVGGSYNDLMANGDVLGNLPVNNVTSEMGGMEMSETNEAFEGMDSSMPDMEMLDFLGCGGRSMEESCKNLAGPYAMLNKLKLAHYSKEKFEEDPFSTELPLGVPEGLSQQEYFGVHRPYPAYPETGKEYGQSGDVQLQNTTGSEVAIVGVGRPTERCLFGGGGGAMGVMGRPVLDPITSWTELKLYQARSTRRQLACLTKFDKVWKPTFTEDPILAREGVSLPVTSHTESRENHTIRHDIVEPWRGYCLDPNNDLSEAGVDAPIMRSFPYFPNGTASGLSSNLNNAKMDDTIIFPRGTASDGRPGLCIIGYVSGKNLTNDPPYLDITEANWGYYPDVCGITDAVEPHSVPIERRIYKGSMPEGIEGTIERQSDSDGDCSDTNLSQCALRNSIWNNAIIYRPELDGENRQIENFE